MIADLATGIISGTITSINDAKQNRRNNLLQNYYAAKGMQANNPNAPKEDKKILGLSMPVFIALCVLVVIIIAIVIVYATKSSK